MKPPGNSRRPLRIALNHTRLAASGGVEGYIRNLIHYLLDHGHSIDFFGGRLSLRLQHPAFRVVRVPYVRSPRPLRVASFAFLSHRYIAREERKRPYDVVQGFSRTYYHTLYRDGSGCWDDYREQYLDRVARTGLRRLYYRVNPIDAIVRRIERMRYVTRRPKLVLAISNLVRDQIRRRYGFPDDRLRVVYSGVDCEAFHPRLRDEGRKKLEALAVDVARGAEGDVPAGRSAAGRRFLAFVGNDYQRKGIETLLEALARLEAESPRGLDYVVVVAGADRRQAVYAERARKAGLGGRVRFLGARQDIPDLLAGADLLLLPSFFDAFSNIAGESMASGTPVLVSSSAGASEWVRDGVEGWVVKRGDPEDLLRCLRAFFAVQDLQPLRDAAREKALAYSWEKHFAEIESIYYELAGAGAGDLTW